MRGITSPEYFSALGIPIIAGRNFTADEINQNLPVLVVNQALAKRLWPGQSAVGKHLLTIPPHQHPTDAIRFTVIAVQGNARQMSLEDEPRPEITRPMPDYTYLTLAVRSTMNPASLTAAIERQIWAVDKSLPIYNLRTMQEVVDETLSERRFSSALLTLFSGLGIVLACVGIYGILTFGVVQRTREIGVRMALGASRADVLRMILHEGLLLVLAGICIGLAVGMALARLLASLLFGLSPTNPATYALVFCEMLVVAAVAYYLPARRATSIEPIQALHYE